MYKLQVDNELLGTLIQSAAPLVQKLTTWDLRLPLLRWRVIPQDRCYGEIYVARMRCAGIPAVDTAPMPLSERLTKHLVDTGTLAAYEPGQGEILVVRENVDDGNVDGLRLILAHELAHRAQHIRFPELFTRIDDIIRNLWFISYTNSGQNPVRERLALDRAMSVLESHAAYVQESLRQEYFPLARIETPNQVNSLILRMLRSEKASQYTRALPMIHEAAKRGQIDELYQSLFN